MFIKMTSLEVEKPHSPSFRRKPESSNFRQLQTLWTPVFTGVTTFYELVFLYILSAERSYCGKEGENIDC